MTIFFKIFNQLFVSKLLIFQEIIFVAFLLGIFYCWIRHEKSERDINRINIRHREVVLIGKRQYPGQERK